MGGTDHRPKPRQRKWALCIDAGDSFWDQNANWSLFFMAMPFRSLSAFLTASNGSNFVVNNTKLSKKD